MEILALLYLLVNLLIIYAFKQKHPDLDYLNGAILLLFGCIIGLISHGVYKALGKKRKLTYEDFNK